MFPIPYKIRTAQEIIPIQMRAIFQIPIGYVTDTFLWNARCNNMECDRRLGFMRSGIELLNRFLPRY